MRKIFHLVVGFIVASVIGSMAPVWADTVPPEINWSKTYGGASDDSGSWIQPTSDSGYIILGDTASSGAGLADFCLVKIDKSGNMLFSKTFGGAGIEKSYRVIETSDKGFVMVGDTASSGAGKDAFIVKADANGNKLWEKVFGGQYDDTAYSVVETADHCYLISGEKQTGTMLTIPLKDIYLIKLKADGTLVWEKTIDLGTYDAGTSILPLTDGGFMIGGATASMTSMTAKALIMKIDANGAKVWSYSYGINTYCLSTSMIAASDGGYVLVGVSSPSQTAADGDIYVLKTNATGTKIWDNVFAGANEDAATSVVETAEGYLICGYTKSQGAGLSDIYLIQTKTAGDKLWEKTYGASGDEQGYCLLKTASEEYLLLGMTNAAGAGGYDAYLAKLSHAATVKRDDLVGVWKGLGVWSRNSDSGAWNFVHNQDAVQVVSGDTDGDGKDDIIGWWSFGIWAQRSSTGAWEKIIDSTDLLWLAAGDLNGDKKDDIVGSFSIGVWGRDSASGAWNRIHDTPAGMIACGNLDGDSKDDLIGVWTGASIWVHYGTGTWAKILEADGLLFLNTGDMNGDLKDDLIGSWGIGVWCRDSTSGSWSQLMDTPAKIICAGDTNGGSLDDLLGIWDGVPGIWARYSENGQWEKLHDLSPAWINAGKLR